ncbi:hypothetical protein R1flu_006431 [Riccia fluitans]|uniref:RRM domain-containing protein n=1 Tax=Riccia fluitans TaxID=41844 RepID=A0ABD1YW05_9MARC
MAYVDNGEDELDYEDEDYPETGRTYSHQPGAIAALAEDGLEEDDYEDLYQDVDVGFFQNSEGPQAPARYQNSGHNGGEGYAEEDYAEDYERAGRTRPTEEGRFAEEQAFRERTKQGVAPAARNVKVKTEGDYDQQDYAEGSRPDAILQPKEEEMGDASVNRPGDQLKQAGVEVNRAGDYGATAAPPKASDDREQGEGDSAARAGLAKVKEEGDLSGDNQVRTEMQSGRPGTGRNSKGPSTGAGGGNWANGGGSNEGGASRGAGAPASRLEGGGGSMWPAAAGRGAAIPPGGGTPGGAITPVNASAPPSREVAGAATDYGAKHGAAHQHESGNIMLFVGELHWWTTDAELEAALSEYGRVKNLKFFEEKASGKSKGYCQVEFYDGAAARLCKEKMDGRVFNDRPCIVAFASPQTIKQMGAAQVGKNQGQGQGQSGQGRGRGDSGSGGRGGQMGEGGRGYGRDKMPIGGRGQGPGERGRGSGRGRGGNMAARGGIGGGGGGAPFQGPPGPMGGGPGGMMPPQGMMGGGFDPAFGPPMGGRGGYGMGPGGPGAGFGPRAHPFGAGPGIGPPFPAMGPGLPGVAPHVNPAFFGRANGNGPGIGMDGPAGGWGEGPMPGWVGEEHERRMVYVDEMGGPDYGYPGEMGPERLRPGPAREPRERGADGEWVAAERRRREDRGEGEWDRERHRERGEREGYWEREQGREKEKDWQERERAPRAREKPRTGAEEEERPRSRDEDFGKRRRMVADRKIER